jgi:hypothetical protein
MDFRKLYGEPITGDSWLMRNMFAVADLKREERPAGSKRSGGSMVRVSNIKPLKTKTISRILIRALYEQGLRETLEDGKRQHEFKSGHAYRKYFKTKAEQVMNRLNSELLLGHAIGLSSSYYRPTEQELLQDYLKAVPSLTINEIKDIAVLREQQEVLEKRTQEKDNEVEQLKAKINALEREEENQLEHANKELEELKARQEKMEQALKAMNNADYTTELMILELLKKYDPEEYANLMKNENVRKRIEKIK